MRIPEELALDAAAIEGGLAARFVERDVLAVSGPDALSYLQGQLSQDVAGLAEGASALSLLLSPQGKVDALVRVTRTAADAVLVDVDGGYGDQVASRLARFKLRTRFDLEALAWRALALRGPAAPAPQDAAGLVAAGGGVAAAPGWPWERGVDLLGPSPRVPEGARLCGAEAWEAARIEAGLARMGSELTERTIPAEAGVVAASVSFTKGCYTGQELVARIDARGNRVPRRLRGLVITGTDLSQGAVPPPGTELVLDDRVVGEVTAAARSARFGALVALAYVRREVEPPAGVQLRWAPAGPDTWAEVRELPLVRPA